MTNYFRLLFAFVTVASLTACGPARWAEHTADGHEGGSGTEKPDPEQPPGQPIPAPVTESFLQDDSANKVDILIVNDNSRSMDLEQQKMSERFGSFISAISSVDYQIATTTTDLDSKKWAQHGKILPWLGTETKILKPDTPGAEAAFRKTVVRTETIGCGSRNGGRDCPSGNEQPLKAMVMAMDEMDGANAGFFRPRVDLVVVVLSDEDEMSDGPSQATKPAEVLTEFKNKFGDSKRLNVHGIVIQPGDTSCKALQDSQIQTGSGAAYATHVTELARLTDGTTSSICDSDYATNLSAISRQIRKLVGTFELTSEPRPGSISISMLPAQDIAFRSEGKKVIFATPPLAGTKIAVTYTPQ